MSALPPEIWHLICPYLSQNDLCSLRLADKAASDIAAEYLIPCLRIETSLESLRSLKSIADHPTLRKGVKRVTYEAGLLADIGCVHHYKAHYRDLDHDELPVPVEPTGSEATPRAKRLWEREEKKFDATLQTRFDKYQSVLKEQQQVKDECEDVITSSLAKFRLNHVVLKTGSVCAHVLSQKFVSKYRTDCAIPLSTDPDHTVWQFLSVLVPGLTSLAAQQISLKIFGPESGHTKAWLLDRFTSLQYLRLGFKQGQDADGEPEPIKLSDSWLPASLEAASHSLRSLLVNFELTWPYTQAGRLEALLTKEMPQLRHLDINFLETREASLVTILKGMPKLVSLFIAFIELTDGSWRSTVRRLRSDFNLTDFVATGLLGDSSGSVSLDLCDRDMWSDGERFTMTSALLLYVTDKEYSIPAQFDSEEEFETCYNPFARLEDFEFDEDLAFEFGPVDFDESDDEIEHEIGSDSDSDKIEDGMPDLEEGETSSMNVD